MTKCVLTWTGSKWTSIGTWVSYNLLQETMIQQDNIMMITFKQDRQCTYNVIMRHVVQPLLQWESSKYYVFWQCVCSLRCSAFNVHALYCHLWPDQIYSIFPHYLTNSMILKLLNIQYVFWFSLQFLSETFLILRIKLIEI